MCALFAHECNSFQNSYFIQLLHFKEIKFRTFFQQRGKRIRRIEYRSQNQEGGQAFEPSSTVVHPCTTVEGEMICFYLPVDVVLLSDGIRGQAAGCAET